MAYTDKSYFDQKIKPEELAILSDESGTIIDAAIASADSLIDSYLKNVVAAVPLTIVPEIIKQCSYDIAIFYLHDRIQYSEIPQWVKDKYNAAIDFLTKIAKGIISLDIETENPASPNYQAPDDNIKFFGNDTVMQRSGF